MTGRERFRRRGPLLELAPGCWICVAGVTAIQPADPADGADGLTVVEADGRPYIVLPAPAVMARVVADAMLDWAGERARAEAAGRRPAPGRRRGRRRPASAAGRRGRSERP